MRISWKTLLTLALALLFLVLAFQNVDWEAMLTITRQGRFEYLLAAFVFMGLAYVLRGLRWRVLLSAERWLPVLVVFWGTCVGYLGNSFLPARAGELLRSVLLGRKADISEGFVLATALTERIIDAGVLASIMLLLIPQMAEIPDWLSHSTQVMALLFLVGIGAFITVPRFAFLFSALIHRLPLPDSISMKLDNLMQQFLSGLRAFQNSARGLGFAAYTLLVWGNDVIIFWLVGQAFGMTLTIPQILLLLAALGLSSAVPSTPGYIGIYQFVSVTILTPFGYSRDAALVYILAIQAVTYSAVMLWGGLGLWQLNTPSLNKSQQQPLQGGF